MNYIFQWLKIFYEDSKESDSDEAKNGTFESVTEENEIRVECVTDAVNPGSSVALYLPPDSFWNGFFVLCYQCWNCARNDGLWL